MTIFNSLPPDLYLHVLSYSPTYFLENYKNRGGVFYKQISDEQKNAIASVVVPITKSYSKNRFTSERLYYYTKKLGGKYILYVEDRRNLDWDWNDDTPSYDKFDTYFVRKDEYCPGF